MKAKLGTIIFGLIVVCWGASIILSPVHYSSQFNAYFDFTEIRWPLGGFLIVLGGWFVWSGFRQKDMSYLKETYMCVKCKQPLWCEDVLDLKCPECGRDLEPIKGFYDRHPELRRDD